MVFNSKNSVIDLDPATFRLFRNQVLPLLKVCRQVHTEALHRFFSTNTFRLFPTYPGRYFKAKKPLLARLPEKYRAAMTSLDLRLGPGWSNPPRGWVVNDALGLADCTSVRILKVFVEMDPSDPMFNGYRKHDGFYEEFCAELLEGILNNVPSIKVVEFDGYNSVKRVGPMMSGLGQVVARLNKDVSWGPERGWAEEVDQLWLDALLIHGAGQRVSKNIAIFSGSRT